MSNMSKSLRLCALAGFIFLLSCKAYDPPIAEPFGIVITVQGDAIQVAHAVVNKDPGSQLAAWYYCPGHGFEKGNAFPDSSKYTPIKP